MKTVTRSRTPLRLGFAGGGTDVSPYSDIYGGCVLNATIDMFAHCTIEYSNNGYVAFAGDDIEQHFFARAEKAYPLENPLMLHKAVYNRIVRDFNEGRPLPVAVHTMADAPPGSGLGSSSTMVVAMLSAYVELLGIQIGEYELARLAYEIERKDCGLAGGKQDQYAATFGGFNFMEFYPNGEVLVNPLRIRRHIENELQEKLILYFTGRSRDSAKIINEQVRATQAGQKDGEAALQAMHDIKRSAFEMKEFLLRGDIEGMEGQIRASWQAKKKTASGIVNPEIAMVEEAMLKNGAQAIKISGAGGGGFMMIFVNPERRLQVTRALKEFTGYCRPFQFTTRGSEAWKAKQSISLQA